MTALAAIFVMGIANFAMHRAVMESGHPMLESMPGLSRKGGRRGLLALEFAILLSALLLVHLVSSAWAFGYALYTALNAIAAWVILSHRF